SSKISVAWLGGDSPMTVLRPARSQRERGPVAGQLEIPAPDRLAAGEGAHRALPIDDAHAAARVELLVVHQRLQGDGETARAEVEGYRIRDAGARRAPCPSGHEGDLGGREDAHPSGGVA